MQLSSSLDIDKYLEFLIEDKSARTIKSLEHLHEILKDYQESGGKDYSITTIGKLSAKNGCVSYESIRATANKHYRDLIKAWAAKASTTIKKPLSSTSRANRVPKDNDLLERINDPSLRVVFGQIIAERNKYRNNVNLLKSQLSVTIDKRPVRVINQESSEQQVFLPSLSKIITDNELEALKTIVSDDWADKNEWKVTKIGQVKDSLGCEILPRGSITAIKKIISEIEKSHE